MNIRRRKVHTLKAKHSIYNVLEWDSFQLRKAGTEFQMKTLEFMGRQLHELHAKTAREVMGEILRLEGLIQNPSPPRVELMEMEQEVIRLQECLTLREAQCQALLNVEEDLRGLADVILAVWAGFSSTRELPDALCLYYIGTEAYGLAQDLDPDSGFCGYLQPVLHKIATIVECLSGEWQDWFAYHKASSREAVAA
jgi:hypothetical protein